ncbi:MAG TPA: acetate--CoA ligase family protein [Acetobacteraceae bacterium]|nr:acetate--CoA ligase family protein [Acetobacteraceae bacterium]
MPTRHFASLDCLLAPRSVAVIGASADPVRIGGRPIANMLARGFAGRILPVNPKRTEIQGLPAYPSIAALPEIPETAIVAVPGEAAVDAVAELARAGTKAAIVFTAGFAEMDAAGAALQARMTDAAAAHGMRVLGPNCLGLFNARVGFYPIFSSSLETGWPRDGRIGIASQSGAYGTHIFTAARDRGFGTPICVTTGNEADITLADVIGWLAEDPGTDVIAAYAEGIRSADRFLLALETARRARKPVVLMKVGRSAQGAAAARSHTASVAGNDAVTDAVLAEFGVVRARTTDELLDIAQMATQRIYPVGNTLGVITISGGGGVLIADAAADLGFPMPPMPEATQARLRERLPFAAPRNPVDCTAQAFNDKNLIGQFTEAMVAEGGYTSVLGFFSQTGGAASLAPGIRAQLAATRARYPDRLYALSILAPPERVRDFESDGFVVFEDPTRAVVALHAMGRFGEAFARAPFATPLSVPQVALPATTPDEAAAKALLAQAGVPSAPERVCTTAEEAIAAAEEFGWPVVLKIVSPDILHKSDIGGVLLDVAGADAVRSGFALLLRRAKQHAPGARIAGVLVARQLKGGVECILGIQRDPVFGPVAMFGLGGVFVEVLHDVVLRRCPFGEDEAARMIRSIRGAPLLLGARGRRRADVAALAAMLSRLSVFAAQAGPRLVSIDLNPVLAMPEGEGAFCVDAVIELEETT